MRIAILFLVTVGAWPCLGQPAKDFCAVRLTVKRPDGTPLSGRLIELVDPDGRVVQAQAAVDGVVEFCDFGFGQYTIQVQSARNCSRSTIQGVHLIPGFTQNLGIVVNTCADEGDTFDPFTCFTYVRVRSAAGGQIPGAQVRQGNLSPVLADKYGRVRLFLKPGSSGVFTFSSPGHEPHDIRLACSKDGLGTKELEVDLRRTH